MNIYSMLIENKEFLKVIYSLVIIAISFIIVLKTNRLFKLSFHSGIRYFRNAFFFFGLGFFSRYILKFLFEIQGLEFLQFLSLLLFEFFIIMAGFFLLYSLLWKRMDVMGSTSSLFNTKISLFYVFAVILAVIDSIWSISDLMFFSQVIIFLIASIIAFMNSKHKDHKALPKLFFVAMLLALIAWILNTLTILLFEFNQAVLINTYILNLIFFLLFLYGVVKATGD